MSDKKFCKVCKEDVSFQLVNCQARCLCCGGDSFEGSEKVAHEANAQERCHVGACQGSYVGPAQFCNVCWFPKSPMLVRPALWDAVTNARPKMLRASVERAVKEYASSSTISPIPVTGEGVVNILLILNQNTCCARFQRSLETIATVIPFPPLYFSLPGSKNAVRAALQNLWRCYEGGDAKKKRTLRDDIAAKLQQRFGERLVGKRVCRERVLTLAKYADVIDQMPLEHLWTLAVEAQAVVEKKAARDEAFTAVPALVSGRREEAPSKVAKAHALMLANQREG